MKVTAPQIAVGEVLELGGTVDISYATGYDQDTGEYWHEEFVSVADSTVYGIEEVDEGEFEIWVEEHSSSIRGKFTALDDGTEYEKKETP